MKSPGQGSGIGCAKYDLTVPPVVCFGHGRIAEVGRVAAVLGKRIWLVVGNHSFDACGGREVLLDGFRQNGLGFDEIAKSCGEPTVQQIAKAMCNIPVDQQNVVVVAVGGGATIDFGKALSALATNIEILAKINEKLHVLWNVDSGRILRRIWTDFGKPKIVFSLVFP